MWCQTFASSTLHHNPLDPDDGERSARLNPVLADLLWTEDDAAALELGSFAVTEFIWLCLNLNGNCRRTRQLYQSRVGQYLFGALHVWHF